MSNKEKLFRFNPFNIKNWDDSEVRDQYNILDNSLCIGDTPSELAWDIELYANMGYLIGEMIARYYELVAIKKIEVETTISNDIYRERNQWVKEKSDKPPAIGYFESKALSKYLKEQIMLNQKEASLKRFKIAYDSIQDKQNALKKKMESIGIETYGR